MQNNTVALVVDKNVVDRRSVAGVLRNEFQLKNANIHQSASGKDAISVVQNEERIDWIITDIDLPDGSGFDFLDKARKLSAAKDSAIILMSSRRDKEALLMAAAAGVNDYVLKPFNTGVMATKIRKIAHGHEGRQTERVEADADQEVILQFGDVSYRAQLLDLSLGGCQVRTELMNKGGCIYDVARLTIKREEGDIQMDGKLLRTEVDREYEDELMRAGFRFQNVQPQVLNQISDFISGLKSKDQNIRQAS